MSDLTQLFAVIAKEIGKEPKVLDPFLNILNENFYDTVASIKDLKKEDYEQWKFPKRLADLLLQKSSEAPVAKNLPQDNEIISKNPPTGQTNPSSMEVEKEKTQEQLKEEALREKLKEAKDSITSAEKQSEVLNFLRKILSNISENPSEQKFRRIKRSNKFFQMYLFPNRHAYEFLTGVGFIEEEEAIFLDDISAVKTSIAVIDDILATVNLSQFNPYVTYTSGNEVMCSRNLAIKEGFINYYDELNKLKVKREQLMSLPVKDRKMRVFQHVAGKQQQQTTIDEDSLEDNEKEALSQFNSELKKLIMGLDNQQFQSKSKQDYQKLLKEPLYTKTTIRIKFPENIILEGLFSPMETVQSIIDFVGQNLEAPQQPFYIFQSPPRQIMDKRFVNKTLFELECLPGANFYFGTDDPEYAKKKSYLTSKLMEPFTQKDKIEEEIVC